jgi:hypothetical protein
MLTYRKNLQQIELLNIYNMMKINKHLWLVEKSIRRNAILKCYRYALKLINKIELEILRVNIKNILRQELV